jgi:dephospho-CoA kinase
MLVIGLTGGIGSGKTTVAKLFAQYGVPVIDADLIARELTEPPQLAWEKIKAYFGPSILNPDHSLNRQKLRELVFNETEKRLWLEQLLHPLITETIEQRIQQLNAPYCIVVIPLLIETGPYSFIDRILVVDLADEMQMERLQKRDEQTSPAHLLKIVKTQSPREKRLAAANELIHNDGLITDLEIQVKQLHQFYLSLAQA